MTKSECRPTNQIKYSIAMTELESLCSSRREGNASIRISLYFDQLNKRSSSSSHQRQHKLHVVVIAASE